MKRTLSTVLIVCVIAFSACTKKTAVVKKSPTPGKSASAPGQIKKAAGAQSAAAFAPGNAKKTASVPADAKKSTSKSTGSSSKSDKKK